MSSSATIESAALATNPPPGWVNDKARMFKNYYWTNGRYSLKGVLRSDYELYDAEPLWTRKREFGSVQFIFQAKFKNKSPLLYYYWDGLSDTVLQFEEPKLDQIRKDIETHGEGKGYLRKIKFRSIEGLAEGASTTEL